MWTYRQADGELLHNGEFVGTGYSGAAGNGRNNPEAETEIGTGPIPRGRYEISDAYESDRLGPLTMRLEPCEGTDTFGRSAFRIHGDNARHDASEGCVILGPAIRQAIAESGDHQLSVV